MEEGIRPRLGAPSWRRAPDPRRELRRFGIGLAVILCVFAALAFSKSPHKAALLAKLAGAALGLALAWPPFFKPLAAAWMPVARLLAKVNTWLLMGLIYWIVLTPYAVLLRLFGSRFLDESPGAPSYWVKKAPRDAAASLKRQF